MCEKVGKRNDLSDEPLALDVGSKTIHPLEGFRRVERARQLVAETGLEGERIDLRRTEGSAEESWEGFWADMRKKLAEPAGTRGAAVGR